MLSLASDNTVQEVLFAVSCQSLGSLRHDVESCVIVLKSNVDSIRFWEIVHKLFRKRLLIENIVHIARISQAVILLEFEIVEIDEILEVLKPVSLIGEHIAAGKVSEWFLGYEVCSLNYLVTNLFREVLTNIFNVENGVSFQKVLVMGW